MGGNLGQDLLDGWRVEVGGDGAVDVVDEAADATVHTRQREPGNAGADGMQRRRRYGAYLMKGAQVGPREVAIVYDAHQGRSEPALGMIMATPMDGGGGHGVTGRASEGVTTLAQFALSNVRQSAVEVEAAVFLVVGYGSDGEFSFGCSGLSFDGLRMTGVVRGVGSFGFWGERQDFTSLSAYGRWVRNDLTPTFSCTQDAG